MNDAPDPPAADLSLLEERAEDLYEDAPCGYLSTRPDGMILKVNRTFERWTGHRREDLVGRVRFQDLLAAGDRIYLETHYRPLLQMQGAVSEIALQLTCSDERRLPILVNSVLRRDEQGRERVVRTTVFDATDRRAYERELLHARERAERLQRHSELLAESSRVLSAQRTVAARARSLLELLAGGFAEAAALELRDGVRERAGVADAAEAPDLLGATLRSGTVAMGERAVSVPLRVQGELIGALALTFSAIHAAPLAEELPLLEAIADRAAMAFDNARLYERERVTALTLQRAMLAGSPPADPRCTIGTYYTAAVDTLEVGGDWHDAFTIAPGRVAVVVGDVVGKGLEAAATMGQVRSALRALALTGLGPAAVLAQLDGFVEQAGHGTGATVALAELDLDTGLVRLACAGHPPPILLPAAGEPELVWGGRSTPLGAWATSLTRGETLVQLTPGARLLLYSDGIVERRDRTIDVGIERLMQAFARRRDDPVEIVGAELSGELLPEQQGADDVCILTLMYAASGRVEDSVR